jgi:two-component system KDP operon response regulator KdpE
MKPTMTRILGVKMTCSAKILVIDDEPQIRRFLRISLGAQGYQLEEAETGKEGIEKCALDTPDIVILDLGLPDMDGQEVLRRIRDWSDVPMIVLSVRRNEEDKVTALDNGANDYVTKPFGIAELVARIRVMLRNRTDRETSPSEIVAGDLHIDLAVHRVSLAGQLIKLTKKEFALLSLLARNAGRIVTHQQILGEVWGPAQLHETHYLRIYIGHLRQKLGDDPLNPRFIENEPGVGYRFKIIC